MANTNDIREGMQVYGAGDRLIGTVERVTGDSFEVGGSRYSRDMVARVAQNRVYVRGTGLMDGEGAEEIRVPVAEERLAVGTREVSLGEVAIHKTVTEEQQTVPVTLTREEVHVAERAVTERPATGDDLFQERTIRVALRGEEAVVAKETVVTGEVVVDKESVAEERQITDTVRRQQVEVEQSEVTTGVRDTAVREVGRTTPVTEPVGASQGFTTARRTQLQEGIPVFGSDDEEIGSIKEVRTNDFLVNRRMRRDVYVPLTAIRDATADRVVLTVASSEVNDQGWPNP